jgi:hypothetical protein
MRRLVVLSALIAAIAAYRSRAVASAEHRLGISR